jgi:hypothetical protein
MQISTSLFVAKWKMIMASIVVLVAGKLAVMMAAGQMFGLSRMASLRAGAWGWWHIVLVGGFSVRRGARTNISPHAAQLLLVCPRPPLLFILHPPGMLLATGGEFAFVAFGEAVAKGVLPADLTAELYMVVALSMALVPYMAALGGKLGALFERSGARTARSGPAICAARCAAYSSLGPPLDLALPGRPADCLLASLPPCPDTPTRTPPPQTSRACSPRRTR